MCNSFLSSLRLCDRTKCYVTLCVYGNCSMSQAEFIEYHLLCLKTLTDSNSFFLFSFFLIRPMQSSGNLMSKHNICFVDLKNQTLYIQILSYAQWPNLTYLIIVIIVILFIHLPMQIIQLWHFFCLIDDEHVWQDDGDSSKSSQEPEHKDMATPHSCLGLYF